MALANIYVGCAGWSLPSKGKNHLQRYAELFPAVEINSSFYRPHQRTTYEKWAAGVPAHFKFSLKISRDITHVQRLSAWPQLTSFLAASAGLKEKRGPLLVQLPPSLAFDAKKAQLFFSALRQDFSAEVVCEPRHRSWLTPQADKLLVQFKVARVATDPFLAPHGQTPGGWKGLVYYRLHGSPRIYYSAYETDYLRTLAQEIERAAQAAPVWCIFDNTAEGFAYENALALLKLLQS